MTRAALRRAAPVAVAAATWLAPAAAFAQSPDAEAEPDPAAKSKAADAEPAPEVADVMRYPPSSVRLPLIIGGSFVTLAAYGATLASGLVWDDVPGADAMLVPIVGPWIALGQSGCAPDDPDCGAILYVRGILLVLDGIAQAAGLGLIGEGIFMTTEADAPAAEPKASWTVAPIIAPQQTGLSVIGSF